MSTNINTCFISYRNPGDVQADKYVQAFVNNLQTQLKLLNAESEVFFDKRRLGVGDFFDPMLAYQLCRSACMVILFSPCYIDPYHPYCAMEYQAMLNIETTRLQGMADLRNRGLIFPVILRGSRYLPKEIGCRQFDNLEDIILCETDFKKPRCLKMIKSLAEKIFERYRTLCNANVFANIDCDQFQFPEKDKIMPWIQANATLPTMPGR